MADFEQNIRDFGDDYVRELAKFLQNERKDASGRLINSLSFQLRDEGQSVTIALEAEDYYKNVDEGRRPGSFPPIQAIKDWTNLRGIDESAAYPIARSIYRMGIKPTNITDKINNFMLNSSYLNDFEDDIAKNIEDKLYKEFKGENTDPNPLK